MLKHFLLVFLGGGFGSGLRFLISLWLNKNGQGLHYGTLVVNILGSFLIGLILGLAIKYAALNKNYVLFLTTGFCGGFTTFSAFAYENLRLLKSGDFSVFFIYVLVSLVAGIAAVYLGLHLVVKYRLV